MPAIDSTVIVFTGGDPIPTAVAPLLPTAATVIAADSGAEHASAMGRSIDVAVGDFDSLSLSGLKALEATGTLIERYAIDKDRTDLEIALDKAVEYEPKVIVVVGGYGGRLDHFLGNALVLSSSKYAETTISAFMGSGRLYIVRSSLELGGEPNAYVSLLAMTEPVSGITTRGLRWELNDDILAPGSSRGMSNELLGTDASVSVASGALVVIQPSHF